MEAKLYSEILADFDTAPTRADKIAVLRKYDHPRLRSFLAMVYNPNIKFQVEIPEYRPAVEPAGLNYTYLDIEVPKLYRFIPGHPKLEGAVLDEKRKKSLLTTALESLHKDEAELLVKAITKKDLDVKYLTARIIKEAYPDINIP
jgi:hypothetical protein